MSKTKKSSLRVLGYIAGSFAIGAITVMLAPKIIDKGASNYYKSYVRIKNDNEICNDDIIIRKEKT